MATSSITIEEKFLGIPYDQRWDKLKHVIINLFLGDDSRAPLKVPELKTLMKENYSFSAELVSRGKGSWL